MPTYDGNNEFANKVSLVHAVGDVVLNNINFGVTHVKHVVPQEIDIEIAEAVDSAADGASINFCLQDSADGSSFTTIAQTGAIAEADLVKGYKPQLTAPKEHRQHLQLIGTIAGEAVTAGAVNSHFYPRS